MYEESRESFLTFVYHHFPENNKILLFVPLHVSHKNISIPHLRAPSPIQQQYHSKIDVLIDEAFKEMISSLVSKVNPFLSQKQTF